MRMSAAYKLLEIIFRSIDWEIIKRKNRESRANRKVHIMFCMCDHFEPGTAGASLGVANSRMFDLLSKYPSIADQYRDSDGRPPRRSWFFPPHYHKHGWLRSLVSLCSDGYGEIELHLHHGKKLPDNSANLRATLKLCIDEYARFGIFGKSGRETKYGFIHGDWALNNSRNGHFCGVNDELAILKETGCYADFTLPSPVGGSFDRSNSLYYADVNSLHSNSHTRGNFSRVDRDSNLSSSGLLIVQGPLHPLRISRSIFSTRIVGDGLDNFLPISESRIDSWVDAGISVDGKNDWLFIKTHTHGAMDSDTVLGNKMHTLFQYLGSKYNDGVNFCLHYVTARELYNIIKAAEAGEASDNPIAFKDYLISEPVYDPRVDINEASDSLWNLISTTYS
jgi:hypothetical protein